MFGEIPRDYYCRQFIFSGTEYKERNLEDMTSGEHADIKAKKLILISPISKNYFRVKYDSVQYGPNEVAGKAEIIGQGWEVDVAWDGAKFIVNEKSNRRINTT